MQRHHLVLAALLVLTACNQGEPSAIGEAALAEGDWGWEDGAGCAGAAHVWRLGSERVEMIRHGARERSGSLSERALVYSDRMAGSRGRLESMQLVYNVWDEDRVALQIRDTFTVRYAGGQFGGLQFATREQRYSGENFRRVRGNDLPSGRMMPCNPTPAG